MMSIKINIDCLFFIVPLFFLSFIVRSQLIINEVSQGTFGGQEYVEFLVIDTSSGCPKNTCYDLRGWIIDDNNGWHESPIGAGQGIAAGCMRFAFVATWACVKPGTIIVIYNNADTNPLIPPQDSTDANGNCVFIIPGNSCLLDRNDTQPNTTGLIAYSAITFTSCGNWTRTSMANTGDSYHTVNPNNTSSPYFSIGWETNTDLETIYFNVDATATVMYMANTTSNNPFLQANWISASASTSQTPGAPNNASNAAWINSMSNNCGPITNLIDSTTTNNATCNGSCNGNATVFPSGGTSPYTYKWNDPSSQTTSTATGLCAETFSVTVTDSQPCKDTAIAVVTITEPTKLNATITSSTGATCIGQCDGSASASATGGKTAYTFTWNDAASQTGTTATGLCPGTYVVTVKDSANCLDDTTVVIPAGITVNASFAYNGNQCLTGNSFNFTNTGTTGAGASYSWTFANGVPSTSTAENPTVIAWGSAGTYKVVHFVTLSGCTAADSMNIIVFGDPSVTALPLNVSCNGACNGSTATTVTGGTPSFTYLWNDPASQTGINATGLCPGTFTIFVTDANNCKDTGIILITEPPPLTVTTSGTAATCNGLCNGSATATPTGGTTPYNYAWNDPGFQTTQTATGLCAGIFTVTVTDANSCTKTATYAVTQPTALTVTTIGIAATCNGVCNGSATATPSGGTSPFNYLWNDLASQSTATATGLCAGSFTVTVTDANSCTRTATYVVTQPTALTVTTSGSPATCNTTCNGSAAATSTGGASPYNYLWNDPASQSTATATGLCAGTFTVTVTDVNSCTQTASYAVTEPAVISLTTTGTAVACNGGCNGSAAVTTSGGTPGYNYLWNNPSSSTTATATGLCVGTFTVTVTDANSCTGTANYAVTEPTALSVTTGGTAATCNGVCNGSATATPTGGTSPYIYVWNDPLFQTAQTATGLCAGTFTVTVTDANSCTKTATYVVTQPSALTITTSGTATTCSGVCNGSATATPSGGTSPFNYLWNDPASQSAATATGLCTGTFTVTVTDANSCTKTATYVVTQPNALTVTTSGAPTTCNGTCNGSAAATSTGGTSPYNYLWNDPASQSAATATGLCAGTFTVTVTDANSCTQTASYAVTEPAVISLTITGTAVACNGGCNGSAAVTSSGGTPGYNYLWNNPSSGTTATATGLCAGTFTVTVTDANSCTGTANYAVSEPTALSVTTGGIAATCNGVCNGSATATPTGGTSPYIYAWNDPLFQTTQTATGLCLGTFNVTVTDNKGCTKTESYTVTQPAAITLTPSSTSSTCSASNGSASTSVSGGISPYAYQWNDPATQTTSTATGLAAGGYTVTVTDANSCTKNIIVTVNDAGAPTAVITDSTMVACNGGSNGTAKVTPSGGTTPYSYSWNTSPPQTDTVVTGLSAGTYTATITDNVGCKANATVTITEPAKLIGSITAKTDVACNSQCTGSATLSVSGGSGSYTYTWNDPGTQTTAAATGLCAGTFFVTVTDSLACTDQDTVVITQPTALTTSITGTSVLCNGGSTGAADLILTGGTTPFTYSWTPGGAVTQDLTGITAGTYTVTVTDNKGCTRTESIAITQPAAITLTTAKQDANCGQNDGKASVSATGGITAYTYLWNDASSTTNDTLYNITSGSYTVTVTDGNSCTTTATVAVIDFAGGTASTTINNHVACNGICNGSATVSMAGGTSPYTYIWNDPNTQATATATGLCAGSFIVSITDNVGCTSTAATIITEPAKLIGSITAITDVECNAQCTGIATLSVSGGTGSYTFTWNDPGTQTTAAATGLCAGTFFVTVTDSLACTDQDTVVITQPTALTMSITGTSVLCNGGNTGAADLILTGGTTPYTYSWSNGASTQDLSSVSSGTYTVTVTDNKGCTRTESIIITQPSAITLTTVKQDANCGQNDGKASVSATGGITAYAYLWNDVSSTTNDTLYNVTSGSYTVTVTDGNSCTTTATVAVIDFAGGTASTTINNHVACNGICNGSATVSMAGGTSPYTYIWNDPNTQVTATATGLCAGSFIVSITDNVGCTSTATAVITEPAKLIGSITAITDINCNAQCTGSATLSVSGGSGSYTYLWNDPNTQTTVTATGLCAGTFIVIVTDSLLCSDQDTVVIMQPAAVATSITGTSVLCNGGSTGAADLAVSGGTTPYTYAWSNSAATQNITGIIAGTYFVTVTDNKGCQKADSITITQPSILSVTVSKNDATCGIANGNSCVTASGGTTAYSYLWNDSLLQTASCATGLNAGTYSVSVSDSKSCTKTASVQINDLIGGSATAFVVSNVSVAGGCNGSATATISGGFSPFSYIWNDPQTQATATATGLCAGSYCVTITDSAGCNDSDCVNITEPLQFVSSIVVVNATCNGSCNGSADLTVTGGVPGYTYQWTGGFTTQDISGLCAGSYIVTVTDANSVQIIDTATITQPLAVILSTASTDATCNDSCNGSITASVTNGVSPLSFMWNDPATQTTSNATGLCSGNYIITVTDANNCMDKDTVAIFKPTAMIVTISGTQSTCGQGNGTLTAVVSNGTSPYSYLWNDSLSQNTATADSLKSESYNVTVTDANGCQKTTSGAVSDFGGPTATISSSTNVLCPGGNNGQATLSVTEGTPPYTYLWTPTSQTSVTATGLTANSYIAQVFDSNGCITSVSHTVTAPLAFNFTFLSNNPGCSGGCNGNSSASVSGGTPGYTYLWNDPASQADSIATGLCAGAYILTVTDGNSCIANGSVTLNNPVALSATLNVTNVTCFGSCNGSATANVSGGISPYIFNWNTTPVQTTQNATGLCAGNYITTVTDSKGCIVTSSAVITEPAVLNISLTSSSVKCFGFCDGFAQASVTGGVPAYTYLWNNGQNSSQVSSLCSGTYRLTVTDMNGCKDIDSVLIIEPAQLLVNFTQTNASCNGACNGSASANPSGGIPPYTWQWNDPAFQTTSTAAGLCAGQVAVIVKDANNCQVNKNTQITQPQSLGIVITTNKESICKQPNGSACISPSGGISPYTIQWNDAKGTTGPCVDSLFGGVYIPVVTDGNGCITDTTVLINDISGPAIDTVTTTELNCFGDSTASAIVTLIAAVGTPPFTYTWLKGTDTLLNGSSTFLFPLPAGSYTISVRDFNNCIESKNFIINQPVSFSGTIQNKVDATCKGVCDGLASVFVVGGASPYTYLWMGSGAITQTKTAICAGNHTVKVSDNKGCSIFITAAITEPPVIVINDSLKQVSCNGGSDGQITVFTSGGTGQHTYTWLPAGTAGNSSSATNLSYNTYVVAVTDANNCIVQKSINITQPVKLSNFITSEPTYCSGAFGKATAEVSGGTRPYTYLWNPGGKTDSVATGLDTGTYTVYISDINGCKDTGTKFIPTLGSPKIDSSAIKNTSCAGYSDGEVKIFVSGGVEPYLYQWNDASSQTSDSAKGLFAGTFLVTVTDANSCAVISSFTVQEPIAISLSKSSDTLICYGDTTGISVTPSGGTGAYTYNWNFGLPATNTQVVSPTSNTTYIVTVTDFTGCFKDTSILVSVSQPLNVTLAGGEKCPGDTFTFSPVVTGGKAGSAFSYLWSDASSDSTHSIFPSSTTVYSVIVSDGCSEDDTAMATLVVHPLPLIIASGGCVPDSFKVFFSENSTISSGTIVSRNWDFGDGTFSTSQVVTHVYSSSNKFTVKLTVFSDKGCKADTTFTVQSPPVADFTFEPKLTTSLNPTIKFYDLSSNDVIRRLWDFGEPNGKDTNYSAILNPVHNYSDTGIFQIILRVENDAGCVDTAIRTLKIESEYILFAPNAFTPYDDGTGTNDFFLPKIIGVNDAFFEFFIFNRWGDMIYHYKGAYTGYVGWNGKANDGADVAQNEVYVWVVFTKDFNGKEHEYIGHVTLLR